jgi:hypothetical protein
LVADFRAAVDLLFAFWEALVDVFFSENGEVRLLPRSLDDMIAASGFVGCRGTEARLSVSRVVDDRDRCCRRWLFVPADAVRPVNSALPGHLSVPLRFAVSQTSLMIRSRLSDD